MYGKMCFALYLSSFWTWKVCAEVITATLDFLGSGEEWVNIFLRLVLGLNRLGKEWEYEGILAIFPWVIVRWVQRLLMPTLWSFAPEQFVTAGFDAKEAVWVTVNFTFPTLRQLKLSPVFTGELFHENCRGPICQGISVQLWTCCTAPVAARAK